jgi:nucleoside-diphosphate-sugar epimerase
MKVLVAGGATFIGPFVAEYNALKRHHIIVFGNVARPEMLGTISLTNSDNQDTSRNNQRK